MCVFIFYFKNKVICGVYGFLNATHTQPPLFLVLPCFPLIRVYYSTNLLSPINYINIIKAVIFTIGALSTNLVGRGALAWGGWAAILQLVGLWAAYLQWATLINHSSQLFIIYYDKTHISIQYTAYDKIIEQWAAYLQIVGGI